MKVVLSALGKFHTFDLARELQRRDALACVFSAYPAFKLRNEHLSRGSIKSFGWLHTPYMGLPRRLWLGEGINRFWEYVDRISFDAYVSRRLPPCDVFVGNSSSALWSGRAAQAKGAKYVCDRGSSHIRAQDKLLREEYRRWDQKYNGIDPRIIDREEAEYAACDCITVPYTFCLTSFVEEGVPAGKLRKIPYGVNLDRFQPTGAADPRRFDILFAGGMSFRKGVQYLLEAYASFRHPRKSLTFAGVPNRAFIEAMKRRGLWPDDVTLLGHVSQPRLKEVMSRSHVLVLASIEEGLAMVQAQALACGCPVIATKNTGASDLFDDGVEGYILPIRRSDMIAQKLQLMADDPALRVRQSDAGLQRVKRLGGWGSYGQSAFAAYAALAGRVPAAMLPCA